MNCVYEVAGVSKQSVHKHNRSIREYNALLEDLIIQVDTLREVHPGCGLEKAYSTLKPSWIGRDKFIEQFMALGYRIKKKKNYKRTTIPSKLYYPNLIEGLLVWDRDKVWQTDITYYQIADEFYYIIFIIDIYTKVIRGYQVSDHMRAEANIKALEMALKEVPYPEGLIHHSDRGAQFTDTAYRKILEKYGIQISMGLIATDNAYAERINGTIKHEYLKPKKINSFSDLKREVRIAVKHYNERRQHKHLPSRQSPRVFEKQLLHLSPQNRPKVIVYTEGNSKIRAASSRPDFSPETEPQDHVCPMV